MNRWSKILTLIFMCAVSAQSALPMEGSQSQNWLWRIKNSGAGAFGKALSYCSPQAAKETADYALDTIKNNKKLSTALFAAAIGTGIWKVSDMYKWRERTTQKINWISALKKDESPILRKYTMARLNETLTQPHSVYRIINTPHFYQQESMGTARMIEAESSDCVMDGRYKYRMPIKHSGLSITLRDETSKDTYEDKFSRELARYPLDTSIKKIIIEGNWNKVNEMIIHQKSKYLSNPAIYVALHKKVSRSAYEMRFVRRDNTLLESFTDRISLLANTVANKYNTVEFKVQNKNLHVTISDLPLCATPFDIELHLPKGVKMPEIIYLTSQEKPLNELQY